MLEERVDPRRVALLANDYTVVYESPDPANIYSYSPGIVCLPSGRLVATIDLGGPGVNDMPGTATGEYGRQWIGKIFTSDDHGNTWTHRADFPFMHARPFLAGDRIYVLGHAGDLRICVSEDDGNTWSEAHNLTQGQTWHQSACNVHYARGNVYLTMERRVSFDQPGWYCNELAPVLMRAPETGDLLQRETWTFASELPFTQIDQADDLIGIPFWPYGDIAPGSAVRRNMAHMGWLESNVVQFVNPDHIWYDPEGHTFHLWMRAHTGGTGYACILKVVENADGTMTTMTEQVPSGQRIVYLPCPGGHMRFHVLYDEPSARFWLLSSMPTDSMIRPDRLSPLRYNLPNNERHILTLHFSPNMVDWRLAGIVTQGNSPKEARHYASMVIDGDDLHVLSRSGDERAKNAHDGNIITFHTVTNFRKLIY